MKNYRKDGYTWKKRRSGNTIREDHTKLKVDGIEVTLSPQMNGIHCSEVNP